MAQLAVVIAFLAVHIKPHLDEIVARWLLIVFGEKAYPGVSAAPLIYWGAGGRTPDGRTAEEWAAEGVLAIGVGNGQFDDHGPANTAVKNGHCAATLVAETLGVAAMPKLGDLLNYVRRIDATASDSPLALASLVKLMHEVHDGQFVVDWATKALNALFSFDQQLVSSGRKDVLAEVVEELGLTNDPYITKLLHQSRYDKRNVPFSLAHLVVVLQVVHDDVTAADWARLALQAVQHQQQQFNAAAADFALAQIEKVVGPHGRELTLVVMKTDNPAASRYARSQRAGVIIQQTSAGNVQIYIYKPSGVSLEDAARMLRVVEQRRSGRYITCRFDELGQEGAVAGAEQWFYHREGEMLLNGSLAHPDVPPTQIPLDEIVKIVKLAINPDAYHPDFELACKQRICAHSPENPCPVRACGWDRCQQVRFEERLRHVYAGLS